MIGTAIDELRSQNSDPEGQCGLDSDLEVPPNLINSDEKGFEFVSTHHLYLKITDDVR